MFWIGLIVGLFVGANIGILAAALCVAASKKNKTKGEFDYDHQRSTQ